MITRPVRSPEIESVVADHLAHQVEPSARGVMFAGRAALSEGIAGAGGRHVRAARRSFEAEAIAATDPLHAAGLRTDTMQKWRVNEGSITLKINYSDQSVRSRELASCGGVAWWFTHWYA